MSELPNGPISRVEQYLANIAGQETPVPEKPLSRVEQYLEYIAEHGGGGGGSWDDLSGKPFESIGTGLNVDDDGALNADGSAPTWGAVQNKPFTTIGEGLTVDEDGALNAEGGGTSDHRQLTNRDAANQHPISAITGLQDALNGKGTYSKPDTGIPASDLASAVQESLSKANSALQTAPVASVNGKTGTVVLVPADLGIGSVFTLKGSKPTVSDLPASGNTYGDVWYVVANSVGYIWLNDGTEDRWEQLGLSIDLSAYATQEWVGDQGFYVIPVGGIPDSVIASAATWNGKQNAINANNKLPVAHVSGYTTKAMVVTYDDDTTETFNVMVVSA